MSKNNGSKPPPQISTDTSSIQNALKSASPLNVVHHLGDLNRVTVDGQTFYRQEKIFIPGIGTVKCTPYDNHFTMRDSRKIGWTLFCTCGAPAVVINYDVYKGDASAQGALLACMEHTQSGKHMPVNR